MGTLRVRVVSALAPFVQDAVVTGRDRSDIVARLRFSETGRTLPPAEVREQLAQTLRMLKAEGGGSSQTNTLMLTLADDIKAWRSG